MRTFFLLFFLLYTCLCIGQEEQSKNNRFEEELEYTLNSFDRDQIFLTKEGILTVTENKLMLSDCLFYLGNGEYCVNNTHNFFNIEKDQE